MNVERSRRAWEHVRCHLAASQAGAVVRIPRQAGVPHPRNAGARLTSTWPVGQTADYLIEGRPPLAVREFADRYEAFLDTAHAATQVIGTIDRDPLAAMYLGAAILGGAIGTSASNKREGLLLGAGLGLLFAALVDSSLNDGAPERKRSREVDPV